MKLLERPYFKWLAHCAADPLWWLFLAGPIGCLTLRAGNLFGTDFSWKLESGVLLVPMAVAFIAEAVRGTVIGDRRRLTLEARVRRATLAIVELAIFVDLALL